MGRGGKRVRAIVKNKRRVRTVKSFPEQHATNTAEEVLSLVRHNEVPIPNFVKALLDLAEIRASLKDSDTDYMTALAITRNLRATLQVINYSERYSGIKRALIAACYDNGSKTSARAVSRLLKISRGQASTAKHHREEWLAGNIKLAAKTIIRRVRIDKRIPKFIHKWIHDNTTASSNSTKVIKLKVDIDKNTTESEHVIHWCTDIIRSMFERCKLEVTNMFGESVSKSYFLKCMPFYVRKKQKQEGLCPIHYTGHEMLHMLRAKRDLWHKRHKCNCRCKFCSPRGCNHGKNALHGICNMFTCQRCKSVRCPLEWSNAHTNWRRPMQSKRKGGGVQWYFESSNGNRASFMTMMAKEMKVLQEHSEHVIYHKEQMRDLLQNFGNDEIVIKMDYIQNIVHTRGRETTQNYYNKRQTQFLSTVVWYKTKEDGEWITNKLYVDYLSSYLKHNSLYLQKCIIHLLTYIRDEVGIKFTKVWFDTDGGREHFKSRVPFLFASTLPELFDITVHWIYAPSHHGKGDCDSHGAVVKRGMRLFVLDDEHHIDDEAEAVNYINQNVRNTDAFLVNIDPREMEIDSTPLQGSNSFHEFRYCGKEGEVLVRRLPCFCLQCLNEKFGLCEQKQIVGALEYRKLKSKGPRVPKKVRFSGGNAMQYSADKQIPEAILGCRFYEGVYQYQVQWSNREEATWHDADRLSCIELMEDFEEENQV